MKPTYEQLSHFAQTGGLILFVIAFILVLAYALSPANRQEFEEARRIPLEDEDDNNG
ncbi:MAG: CcoQ/FixQ family Cbb3-type cytochrome c oxidase assembly chaperone [Alphaproteobacteria bacterium]|nr:CcoQ/FixQ family Cbb3-type cytochrome c oxidase assembly chaperone [Alphaproteobacteria bacterium]